MAFSDDANDALYYAAKSAVAMNSGWEVPKNLPTSPIQTFNQWARMIREPGLNPWAQFTGRSQQEIINANRVAAAEFAERALPAPTEVQA